jgi:2,4-dienoyl-CoA reductase-like NADH-dependent reductase (Old Yellow Enzyme family)
VSTDPDVLFAPFALKTLSLKNRIVMAPMTRAFAQGGLPGDPHVAYYRRRAEGQVGLILSEGAVIERPHSRNDPGVPFFHGPALEGWKQVIDAVHAAGAAMGPQLWHTGSIESLTADWTREGPAESPSGLVKPGHPSGVAMSQEDIADSVAAWARAACDARRLGYDTLEVHGAHGYLVDQFFWSGTNQREDRYGGATVAERSRYAVEVIAAIRAAVGPDFPIILRVSQWKQQDLAARLAPTPDLMAQWLAPLVEAGVDILHCSQRRFWTPEFPEIDGEDGLNLAGWAKKLTGAATISVGSVGLSGDFINVFAGERSTPTSLDGLIRRMERGEFDLIAVGRALITDPDWAVKVRAGDQAGLKPFASEALAEFV